MKKNIVYIFEGFIWLLIITTVVFGGTFLGDYNSRKNNSYTLSFNDVDGLMKGSAVRFMGMQVGYITELTPIEDQIQVTFRITQKELKLPKNCSVTVEFTGIVGSKSLEIEPPGSTADDSKFKITPKDPIRIQMFFDIQKAIATSIVNFGSSVTKFVGEDDIPKVRQKIKKMVNTSEDYEMVNAVKSRLISTQKLIIESLQNTRLLIQKPLNNLNNIKPVKNKQTIKSPNQGEIESL